MFGKTHPKLLFGTLFWGLLFFSTTGLMAQTEAQAGSDVLELQKVSSGRTTLVQPGDAIRYPVKRGKFNVEQKADVVSVESDDELVVRNRKRDGETVQLKISELAYFRRIQKWKIALGWTLIGLGLVIKLLVAITVALAFSYWTGSLAIVAFLGALVLEFYSPILILPGALLVGTGRRRIFKPKWSWKKKRMVKVKGK